jgi:hypothetical protein
MCSPPTGRHECLPRMRKMSTMHTERTEEVKSGPPGQENYRHCGKDKLVEHTMRPCQPTLEGVASRGLLILLDVVARLNGSCPGGAGKVDDLGIAILGILRQGRARALPSLLYLRGGGPRCALGSITLLRRCRGMACRRCHLADRDNGTKQW